MGCAPSSSKPAVAPSQKKLDLHKNTLFEAGVDYDSYQVVVTPAMRKDDETRSFLIAALRRQDMFATHRATELAEIVEYFAKVDVSAGDTVITQGEQGDYFYVVERGQFDFVVDGRVAGSCADDGSSFGELALVYGAPRAATVVAKTRAVLWAVDRLTFRASLARIGAQSKQNILNALANVELLDDLTDEQLEAVAGAVRTVTCADGERIITKNETGNVFYMIQSGGVVCSDIGHSSKVLRLGSGDYFGERALLTDQKRFANVDAEGESTTLLALDREAFVDVLGGTPLMNLLVTNLLLRVLSSMEDVSTLPKEDLERVAALFQEVCYARNESVRPQTNFIVVKSGRLVAAQEQKILQAGDHFGQLRGGAIDQRVFVAHENSVCLVLSRDRIQTTFGKSLDDMILLQNQILHSNDDSSRSNRLSEFAVKSTLGSGKYGKVKLVRRKNKAFVLKVMNKKALHNPTLITNEKLILTNLHHPFIVELHATFQDSQHLYSLLELVQGGDLSALVKKREGLGEKMAKFYAAAVSQALAFLHSRHIIYRDLKPKNVMIDARGYPKLVDFCFAKNMTNCKKSYTLCGTPEYLAPEILLGRGHDASADWWAFGILIYEMLVAKSPFNTCGDNDPVALCKNILNAKVALDATKNRRDLPTDLLSKLIERDPTRRLSSASHVVRHRWFASVDFYAMLGTKTQAPWIPHLKNDQDCSYVSALSYLPDAESQVDTAERPRADISNEVWEAWDSSTTDC